MTYDEWKCDDESREQTCDCDPEKFEKCPECDEGERKEYVAYLRASQFWEGGL